MVCGVCICVWCVCMCVVCGGVVVCGVCLCVNSMCGVWYVWVCVHRGYIWCVTSLVHLSSTMSTAVLSCFPELVEAWSSALGITRK